LFNHHEAILTKPVADRSAKGLIQKSIALIDKSFSAAKDADDQTFPRIRNFTDFLLSAVSLFKSGSRTDPETADCPGLAEAGNCHREKG